MAKKLTDGMVDKLSAAPPGTRSEHWDNLLPGFGVRVTDKGRKSWVVMFRVHGRQRRLTLGAYPAMSLKDARKAAQAALRAAQTGTDPAEAKRTARVAGRDDMAAVVAEFIQRYAKPKNRSWRATERILNREVLGGGGAVDWSRRRIQTIAKRDILEMLDSIMDRGTPYQANRTLAAVRKLMNWAMNDRGMIEDNPTKGIGLPGKEDSRERTLEADEVAAIWAACEGEGYPFGPLFQLLMATGQRVQEAAQMKRSHVKRGIWTLPTSKSGRQHDVPLSPLALAVLDNCPRTIGGYVFSTTGGVKPVSGISKAKDRIEVASGVTGWRLHDLRRTAATNLARLKVPQNVLSKILNHAPRKADAVTAIYNRHGYADEKRAALDAWGAELSRVVGKQGGRKHG